MANESNRNATSINPAQNRSWSGGAGGLFAGFLGSWLHFPLKWARAGGEGRDGAVRILGALLGFGFGLVFGLLYGIFVGSIKGAVTGYNEGPNAAFFNTFDWDDIKGKSVDSSETSRLTGTPEENASERLRALEAAQKQFANNSLTQEVLAGASPAEIFQHLAAVPPEDNTDKQIVEWQDGKPAGKDDADAKGSQESESGGLSFFEELKRAANKNELARIQRGSPLIDESMTPPVSKNKKANLG